MSARTSFPSIFLHRCAGVAPGASKNSVQGAKISEGLADSFFRQCSLAGFPASYLGIKAFSETDFTEDLKKFDVPTLTMHADDDQVVPIAGTAILSAKLIKNAILKVYPGLPHGMCQTHKDLINADCVRPGSEPVSVARSVFLMSFKQKPSS